MAEIVAQEAKESNLLSRAGHALTGLAARFPAASSFLVAIAAGASAETFPVPDDRVRGFVAAVAAVAAYAMWRLATSVDEQDASHLYRVAIRRMIRNAEIVAGRAETPGSLAASESSGETFAPDR